MQIVPRAGGPVVDAVCILASPPLAASSSSSRPPEKTRTLRFHPAPMPPAPHIPALQILIRISRTLSFIYLALQTFDHHHDHHPPSHSRSSLPQSFTADISGAPSSPIAPSPVSSSSSPNRSTCSHCCAHGSGRGRHRDSPSSGHLHSCRSRASAVGDGLARRSMMSSADDAGAGNSVHPRPSSQKPPPS